MDNVVIGIDIGGTNFRIGAVDEKGNVKGFIKKPSAEIFDKDAVQALYNEIILFAKENKIEKIKAVTIGIPSIVSKDKKTVYSTPNLKGFDNVNIGDPLEKLLNVKVFVDRDVNFLLENDLHTLSLDKQKMTAGFYIGTGFGNAIYMDGKFLTGKNGAAGELGHIPLYGVDDMCTCNNTGCVETRCSGKRLEYICEKHFPGTKINEVFEKHSDSPIIRKFVYELAIPIATEINILDPDYIVIAGGVVIMKGFLKDVLIEAIHFYTRKPYPEKNLEILFTEHTQQSGVLGGARFAFDNL